MTYGRPRSRHQRAGQLGLHLVDVNLTMGNLLDIVGAEAKAFKIEK
jgi:hypothetical protein